MDSLVDRVNKVKEMIRDAEHEKALALETLTQVEQEAAKTQNQLSLVEEEEELRRKAKVAKLCDRAMRRLKHSTISCALIVWNANSSACILERAALEKKRASRAREAEFARLIEEERKHAEDAEVARYLQATEARIAAQLQLATSEAVVMEASSETDEDGVLQYLSRAKARAETEMRAVRREVEAALEFARISCVRVDGRFRRHPRRPVHGISVSMESEGTALRVYLGGLVERVGYIVEIQIKQGRDEVCLHANQEIEIQLPQEQATWSVELPDSMAGAHQLSISVYDSFPGLSDDEMLLTKVQRLNWHPLDRVGKVEIMR